VDDRKERGGAITSASVTMWRTWMMRILKYLLAVYFVLGQTLLACQIYLVGSRYGTPVPSPRGIAALCLAQNVLALLVIFRGRRALREMSAWIELLVQDGRRPTAQLFPVWAALIITAAAVAMLIAVYVWPDRS